MDTEQLATFWRVVREGSFSRAARALDVAQPTVSARIQALEAEVGGPLLVRGGRHVALTPRGESFLPYAQRALAVLAEGVEAARLIESGQGGRVTVGAIESLAGGFLAVAVARYHASHPRVELFVRSAHSDQIVRMVEDGVVQLGLLRRPTVAADITTLLRFREPLVLVAPVGHPLTHRAGATLEDVRRLAEPLLLVRWGQAMRPVLARLQPEAANVLELPIDTVRRLLARGTGAAFLTATLAAEEVALGRVAVVPLTDLPQPHSESLLICRATPTALPPAAAHFVRVIHDEAGDLCLPLPPD